jgi:hypothetical protein
VTGQAALPADRTDTRLHRAVTGPLLFLFILGYVLGADVYARAGQVAAEVGGAIWVPLLAALLLAGGVVLYVLTRLAGRRPSASGAAWRD